MKAQEFLLEKGINKVHQPKKRYSLTVEELVMFLEDFARREKETMKPVELAMYRSQCFL